MAWMYDSLLILTILVSWIFTLRELGIMHWERLSDARDLREYFSKFTIEKKELANLAGYDSGTALIVDMAEHRGRRVIVKRWQGAAIPDDERRIFAERLKRDFERWRSLKHPNIGELIGVALHLGNLPSFVVPLYQTVSEYVAENRSADVLHLLEGVASALSFLHAQSPPLAYGDLKGSAVFVTPAGTACLSDIGVASIPEPSDGRHHGLSSVRWLAPEVMDPSRRPSIMSDQPDITLPVTPESDMYAFGMLAYQIYTNAKPFRSEKHDASVVGLVIRGTRPRRPSRAECPALSDEMWCLIERCWDADYTKRPRADTVLAWLRVIALARGLGAHAVDVCEGGMMMIES
ncbi:kinase-like domain-containing protein [Mycena rebaudengoi]|nr:kinase-like domain-containing protein [Mycena rebaudengoi]